jgi:hypothetical protein
MRLAVATIVALLAFASPALASPVANLSVDNANPSRAAGARTQYAVAFTTSATGALSNAANSRINVAFAPGTTFAGYLSGIVRTGTDDVGSCGNPIALTIQCSLHPNRSIGAGQAVTVVFNGITNPGTPGSQTLSVTTTADQDQASAQFTVVGATPVTSVTVGNTTPTSAAGGRTQYVVGFTTSPTGGGMSNAANSRIDVTFPAGTSFDGYVSAVVRNLSTAADVGSCGNPDGLVLHCSLFPSATIGAGHSVGITFHGITNPTVPGTDKLATVSTTSDPQPVESAPFTVVAAAPITAVTVDNLTPSRAAGARTQYVVAFTASATGGGMSNAANSRIDVTFPENTAFGGYVNAVVRDATDSLNVGSCGNPSGLTIRCSLFPNAVIGADHDVTITFNGITNPPFPTTDNRARVVTTSDPQIVDSAQFATVAANPITLVSVENRVPSRAAGARTQYVVGFRISATGGLSNAANSRIDVEFPEGTTFGAYVSAVVRDVTAAANVGSCGNPSGLRIQCSLFPSAVIAANHDVTVTFNGITNPPFEGTDKRARVSTTSDPMVVDSGQFGVLAGQALTSVTVEPGSTTASATTPYVVRFVTSSSGGLSNAANSRIDVAFPAGATFGGYTNGRVHDVTDAVDVGSCGNPSGLVIQCSLFPNLAIGAGHAVRITFTSIKNPPTPGTYSVRASTTSDLPLVTSSAYQVGGDTTPPETTIESGPPFGFSSDEPGVRFECAIDDGPYGPCSSPFTPPALAPGEHTLRVRAIDSAGNADGSPATRSFIVQPPPPQPTVAPTPTATPTPEPTPQFNQTVVVEPASGTVEVCPKGGKCFTLQAGQQIPLGSTVNTKKGAVELTSVSAPGAPPQKAVFSEGIFRISQRGNVTELKLTEKLAPCPKKRARAAAKKPKSRKLWGKGSGRFRTVGNYSAATVRGTRWLTQDSCAGTLTRVTQGVVSVSYLKKTVIVRAGKSFLARPKR